MDVKQELCDPHEGAIKTEPVFIYEENEDEDVLNDKTNNFEYQITEQFLSANEMKQEFIKFEVPKLEEGPDYQEIEFECTTVIKQELENTTKVKETDNISDTNQDVQFKNESEILTSHCDLQTFKIENDYPDYYLIQSCNTKPTQDILKPLKSGSKLRNRHSCVVCQESDENPENLTHHLHDSPLGLKSGSCTNLQEHIIDSKEKTFHCDICSKEFKHKLSLQNHLKVHKTTLSIHTIKKPFHCDICFKEFTQKSSLHQHSRIHNHEKPFKCDICSKVFNRNSSLHRHLITHSEEKPFKCDICYKEFNLKTNLERHLVIHSNEKPFKCDICSREFNLNFNLERHLLTHNDKKSFKCDICSTCFKHKRDLESHLIIHTDKKPYKCDICSKEFNLKSNLQKHLIIVHNNEIPF